LGALNLVALFFTWLDGGIVSLSWLVGVFEEAPRTIFAFKNQTKTFDQDQQQTNSARRLAIQVKL
jgi:hypothetical protein